ncbi:MAG: hypothetical protein IJT23_08065 [Clostridia bacterium]|nr:hypothetical protein [Clostridia bacterium]
MHRIDELIKQIKAAVDSHCLGRTGEYARWIIKEPNRNMGLNEYGCADAANILYTLCEFPAIAEERAKWVGVLQSFQNEDTGMFSERTHFPLHTTAHCTAALELFEAKPKYRFKQLEAEIKKRGIENFLDGLDWINDPWSNSHLGAGIYASLKLVGDMTPELEERYFTWLWNESDPETGLWRKDSVQSGNAPIYYHMASTFHYLFNHEYARRPIPYPERLVDTCLDMYYNSLLREDFGKTVSFLEMDWVYCLNRAMRLSGYRIAEGRAALKGFADEFIEYLYSIDKERDTAWDDLHNLFGTLCALAELEQALYGYIITDKPLRLVLDRRPFI